jgi:hypothetical protein
VLGLRGKMCGATAIVRHSISPVSDEVRVEIALKAIGNLGLWVSDGGIVVKKARLETYLTGTTASEAERNLKAVGEIYISRKGNV